MSNSIVLFFSFIALASMVSGISLPRFVPQPSVRKFSIGLFLMGSSFGFLAIGLLTPKIDTLHNWVLASLATLLLALLYILRSATHHLPSVKRKVALFIALLFGIILWRAQATYPFDPNFASNGLFLFNPHPYIIFMEIGLVTAILSPATLAIFHEIRKIDIFSSNVFFTSMLIIRVGIILILSSAPELLLVLAGIAMIIAFCLLVATATGLLAHGTFRTFWLVQRTKRAYDRVMHHIPITISS